MKTSKKKKQSKPELEESILEVDIDTLSPKQFKKWKKELNKFNPTVDSFNFDEEYFEQM